MNSLLRYNMYITMFLVMTLALLPSVSMAQKTEVVEVLNDPTMPLFNVEHGIPMHNTKAEDEEIEEISLVLQGIVIKSGKKFAVINGQVLSEGQLIEGFQLKSINDYEVELQGEGDEGELSLTLHKVKIKH